MKLSVQTFTIRKHLKSVNDIDASFSKFSELGVQAIELAYVKYNQENIDAIIQSSEKYGIEIGSSQITFRYLQNNFDWVVKFHKLMGCKITSVSVLPDKIKRGSKAQLIEFAKKVNELAARYKAEGIEMLYHHHHYEFKHFGDSLGMDVLEENFNKELVGWVLDTYWLQRGGVSPQAYIEKMKGRVKVVHLRDFKVNWGLFSLKPKDAELGKGNMNFTQIVEACRKSGVTYGAIEQDCATPFESLKISVDHFNSI